MLVVSMASVASASCRNGNPTVNDYVCSGTTTGAGDGLTAASTTGNLTVKVRSGSVTGGANGINASTTAADSIGISVNGNVTGATGAGIASTSNLGYSQIDIATGAIVKGAAGVQITTNGAYGILNNSGSIAGGNAPGLALSLGVGSESINNNGSITAIGGTAATVASGTVTFNNNTAGIVEGSVTGNVTTLVNNFGKWRNAGGSSIGTLVSSGALVLSGTGTHTLTVSGDTTFNAASSTVLAIAPGGASDTLAVGGDVTINGGTLTLHGTGTGYTSGTHYTLLTSGGVVSGAFASVTTDIPKFLPIFTMSATGFSATLAQYDFRDLALTRNQFAAASAVAQAPASTLTPGGTAILLALDAMSPAQIQAGFTQMAGDGLTAAKSIALRQGSQFAQTVDEQQAFWRSRENVDPNGITIAPLAYAPVSSGPQWYAGQIKPLPPRPVALPADRTLRMWISGFGADQTTKGNALDGSAAQTGRVGGGVVGIDAQLGRNMLLGVAGGYSVGAFSVTDRQTSGSNNGLHVAMYTGFTANGFYGSANVGYANFNTSTKRTVNLAALPVEQESGSFGSHEFRVRLETGKLVDLGIGTVTAFTAIQGATLSSNPYVETSVSGGGSGVLGLAFLSQTTRSVPIEIGFRAETRLRMGVATLAPWLQVALVHDFSTQRTNSEYLALFPGVAQTVYGAADARDTLRLKGGAQLTFSSRAAMFVSAEADLSRTQRVYSGKGGFRYGW